MKYLSNYTEQAQTELFNNTGSFFAFGNKQFEDKKKQGVKYAHLGGGLICPVENIEQLKNGLNSITEAAIKQDVEENGADAIIQREYFNYESQISMDTTEARDSLSSYIKHFPDLFTEDKITTVFKKCFNLACVNDWF